MCTVIVNVVVVIAIVIATIHTRIWLFGIVSMLATAWLRLRDTRLGKEVIARKRENSFKLQHAQAPYTQSHMPNGCRCLRVAVSVTVCHSRSSLSQHRLRMCSAPGPLHQRVPESQALGLRARAKTNACQFTCTQALAPTEVQAEEHMLRLPNSPGKCSRSAKFTDMRSNAIPVCKS